MLFVSEEKNIQSATYRQRVVKEGRQGTRKSTRSARVCPRIPRLGNPGNRDLAMGGKRSRKAVPGDGLIIFKPKGKEVAGHLGGGQKFKIVKRENGPS